MEKKTKENDAFGFELLPDDPKPGRRAVKQANPKETKPAPKPKKTS